MDSETKSSLSQGHGGTEVDELARLRAEAAGFRNALKDLAQDFYQYLVRANGICFVDQFPSLKAARELVLGAKVRELAELEALRHSLNACVEALDAAASDIGQTARANQVNLTGTDPALPGDHFPTSVGRTPIHQRGIDESLSVRQGCIKAAIEARDTLRKIEGRNPC